MWPHITDVVMQLSWREQTWTDHTSHTIIMSLSPLTSSLGHARQLLLIGGVKLEGRTWFKLTSKVSLPMRGSVTAGAEVCVIAHLPILQEGVKEGIITAQPLCLEKWQ